MLKNGKMKDRIIKIIREEGFTSTKFAEEIGVQASSISHILSGRNNPSLDFIVKIIERFRGINPEWLLTGKGEMYKSVGKETTPIEKKSYSTSTPDLFSTNNAFNEQIQNIKVVDKIENTTPNKENISLEPPVIENIDQIFKSNPKNIERIVVFFSDKTFDYYMPNK